MKARWRMMPHEPDRISALSRGMGVPPLIAQLLLNRNIADPEQGRDFLEKKLTSLHDPELIPGMTLAADRLTAAIQADKKIVIYGDYDVDGTCGTSLLWDCLRLAGAKRVEYYIPKRIEEGYGVNGDALAYLKKQGADVVVTVDCGISAVQEALLARSLGLEFLITDHHTIGAEIPKADVVVHPRLPGSLYPFGDLCGAGVAFKLAWQISKSFGDGKKTSPHMRKFLIKSTMLVAMATVADVMPLTDENRFLVHWGLTHMRDDPSVGVRALLAKSLGDKATQTLNTGTIGFQLAPRINAAGRLQSAKAAVDLLTTLDENLARTLAEQLDQLNEERKTIEKTIVNEAAELVRADPHWKDRAGIVVAHKDWHPGVIGIVATRLIEQFHRPCFVIALKEELGQGSGRSIPGFDLHEALTACGDLLVGYGGHSAAAGLKIQPARVDAFRERFEEHCRKLLTPEHFLPTLSIDAEVPLDSLTMRTVDQIQQLEPFGIGNPKPMLVAHNLLVSKGPTLLGNQGVHMQFEVQDAHQHGLNYRVVAWNQWGKYPDLQQGAVCSLAFQPEINDWRNNRKVQLNLKDVRVGPTTHAQPRPHTASAAAP